MIYRSSFIESSTNIDHIEDLIVYLHINLALLEILLNIL